MPWLQYGLQSGVQTPDLAFAVSDNIDKKGMVFEAFSVKSVHGQPVGVRTGYSDWISNVWLLTDSIARL